MSEEIVDPTWLRRQRVLYSRTMCWEEGQHLTVDGFGWPMKTYLNIATFFSLLLPEASIPTHYPPFAFLIDRHGFL